MQLLENWRDVVTAWCEGNYPGSDVLYSLELLILQAVDGATVVAMCHRCSNRSQHFLSLSTGRWCHRYGN